MKTFVLLYCEDDETSIVGIYSNSERACQAADEAVDDCGGLTHENDYRVEEHELQM